MLRGKFEKKKKGIVKLERTINKLSRSLIDLEKGKM